MNKIISIENLTKDYGRIRAVDGLSLEIDAHGVFGILGPNGSGKTTTLAMILDVVNPTSGSFTWHISDKNGNYRNHIGAILEEPMFYPYLSAVANLKIVATIKGHGSENIRKVLEMVNLFKRRDDKFATYSYGMKQRLAIAAALLADPEVLIFDEPTNGLDPQGIAEIRNLIIEIANMGKTVILASHILAEVQKVCSHFAVLKQGKLIYSGKVGDTGNTNEIVEIEATNQEELDNLLRAYTGAQDIKKELSKRIVTLKNGLKAQDISSYFVDNRFPLIHFLIQKPNLEKQFIDILNTR